MNGRVRTNQGIVIISERDLRAFMALRQVTISGIQSTSAMMRAMAAVTAALMTFGKADRIAEIDESSHIHAVNEQTPKNNLGPLRKYLAV